MTRRAHRADHNNGRRGAPGPAAIALFLALATLALLGTPLVLTLLVLGMVTNKTGTASAVVGSSIPVTAPFTAAIELLSSASPVVLETLLHAAQPGSAKVSPSLSTAGSVPSGSGAAAIPPPWAVLSQQAAATCPGLPWTVLAAIAHTESDFGQDPAPGVQSGSNSSGAAGPLQMGIGGAAGDAFFAYDHPVPADPAPNPPGTPEPPSPYNPIEALLAATRMLCSDGAAQSLPVAIYAYNHATWYVDEVLALAQQYGGNASG